MNCRESKKSIKIDVLQGRNINKVIILGSGPSILQLTADEIDHINRCKIVFAVNKFMLFYKKAGILPTHIYFYDLYGYNIYNEIINVCIKDGLTNLTFYVSPFLKMITYSNKLELVLKFCKDFFFYRLKSLAVIFLRKNKNCGIHQFILFRKIRYLKQPHNCAFVDFRITAWNKGGKWAGSIKQKIFHFRGSLTSVINVSSIIAPNMDIALVGNDFNTGHYFYEDELDQMDIDWKDYTYEEVKKTNKHYSFQDVEGTRMTDKIPYILEQLAKQNIKITCNNRDSLLVIESSIKYEPLIAQKNV